MAKKKKKAARGGARKGAGRKETGRTAKTVCFSVPIGHEEKIKSFVKSKLAELKGAPKIKVQDLTQPTQQVRPITDPKPKSNYVAQTTNTDYLKQRQKLKQGLK